MKKLLFVLNPEAGRKRIQTDLYGVVSAFSDADYLVTVYPTKEALEATKVIADLANDYDVIVVSGGDGTLNEAVDGIMLSGNNKPLGYIPTGTTNDFARSLNMSFDPIQAANGIVHSEPFSHEVGLFNQQEHFIYSAIIGMFADLSVITPQPLKNVLGRFAYYLEGVKQLSDMKTFPLRMQLDDQTVQGEYVFCSISSSTSIGGTIALSEEQVDRSDGKFEIILIKMPSNFGQWQGLMDGIRSGNYNHPLYEFYRSAKIRIQLEEEQTWVIDGEDGGKHKDVVIEAIDFIDILGKDSALPIVQNSPQA